MRARRVIASVLLTAFLCGSGGAWFVTGHQFNDDPDCDVILIGDAAAAPRLQIDQNRDSHHCAICHLFRTIRTAHRSVAIGVVRDVRLVVPPDTTEPRTRAANLRTLGARAPPSLFL